MIDLNDLSILFVCWLINVVVDVNWLQCRVLAFDKYGELLSMVNVFISRLTFPFWSDYLQLVPLGSSLTLSRPGRGL